MSGRFEGKVALVAGGAHAAKGELMGFGGIAAWEILKGGGKVVNEVLIPANTSIPCQVKETFFTIAEGQRTVEATVTQGDGEDPDDVQKIAATVLDLPADRPPGRAIEVTYFYDEQGRMHCQFEDQETGKTATLDHGDASPKAMNLKDVDRASTDLDDREIL